MIDHAWIVGNSDFEKLQSHKVGSGNIFSYEFFSHYTKSLVEDGDIMLIPEIIVFDLDNNQYPMQPIIEGLRTLFDAHPLIARRIEFEFHGQNGVVTRTCELIVKKFKESTVTHHYV